MFGLDILDASLMPALIIALTAGLLSFLSPCVLPLVPPYLAYMSGVSMTDLGDRRAPRVVLPAIFFVLGLSTVFLLTGFAASTLGRFFALNKDWFGVAGGVVIMLFGAHFVGVFRIGFLDRDMRFEAKTEGGSAFGAYLLGLAFAFGWTPCLGPILGSILTIAASEASAPRGTALLLAYSLGLGIPFIAVAAFFPRMTGLMGFLKRNMQRIERIMGLLLWTIGLMLVTGQFSDLSRWILETFPWAQSLG